MLSWFGQRGHGLGAMTMTEADVHAANQKEVDSDGVY